jgi:hypothetical protein
MIVLAEWRRRSPNSSLSSGKKRRHRSVDMYRRVMSPINHHKRILNHKSHQPPRKRRRKKAKKIGEIEERRRKRQGSFGIVR